MALKYAWSLSIDLLGFRDPCQSFVAFCAAISNLQNQITLVITETVDRQISLSRKCQVCVRHQIVTSVCACVCVCTPLPAKFTIFPGLCARKTRKPHFFQLRKKSPWKKTRSACHQKIYLSCLKQRTHTCFEPAVIQKFCRNQFSLSCLRMTPKIVFCLAHKCGCCFFLVLWLIPKIVRLKTQVHMLFSVHGHPKFFCRPANFTGKIVGSARCDPKKLKACWHVCSVFWLLETYMHMLTK